MENNMENSTIYLTASLSKKGMHTTRLFVRKGTGSIRMFDSLNAHKDGVSFAFGVWDMYALVECMDKFYFVGLVYDPGCTHGTAKRPAYFTHDEVAAAEVAKITNFYNWTIEEKPMDADSDFFIRKDGIATIIVPKKKP